jgi:UPF0755 protein
LIRKQNNLLSFKINFILKIMMKKLVWLLILILILVLTGLFVIKSNYEGALDQPNSESTEVIAMTIETGESLDQIIEKLISNKILSEEKRLYFKYYVRDEQLFPKFQAGDYKIPQNLTIIELADTLQHAGQSDFWVTIPEGLRKDQIVQLVEKAIDNSTESKFDSNRFMELTTDTQFISTLNLPFELEDLEGVLFPDRYRFPMDISSEDVIITMVNNFKSKIPEGFNYSDLRIASYLEKEGYGTEDRRMIADIVKRRLDEGWYLNLDATLHYNKKDWIVNLTYADLREDHPYNTYTRIGLTPTPICNPGLDSILATVNPTPNSFYYYIHDKNGNAHYAIDLNGHQININNYLK